MTILRRVRKRQGVTAKSVAVGAGIDQSYYCRLEMGKASASPDVAERLARHFNNAVTEMQILYPERYEDELAALEASRP